MEKKVVSNGGILLGVSLAMILFFQSLPACVQFGHNQPDPPTETPTSTPTITPTPTPTGNAPFLIFPINNTQVGTNSITFDWTDPVGAHEYWFRLLVWYPAGAEGSWIPLWSGFYQWSEVSQLTLTRDDIWFLYQAENFGWIPADYAWTVVGDTSTAWAPFGYFTWTN